MLEQLENVNWDYVYEKEKAEILAIEDKETRTAKLDELEKTHEEWKFRASDEAYKFVPFIAYACILKTIQKLLPLPFFQVK